MHALKTGLNADKFVTFWMFPKRFYHSFVFDTLEVAERKYSCAISKTYEKTHHAKLFW